VALENPCKERKRTLIGQLKDSEHCRACLAAEQVRHRSDPNVNVTRVVVPDTQHAVRIVEREPRLNSGTKSKRRTSEDWGSKVE
jgi:hypothetical protein